MKTYTFLRTVKYTENVDVYADSYEEAKELAQECDGTRNEDDIILNMIIIDVY